MYRWIKTSYLANVKKTLAWLHTKQIIIKQKDDQKFFIIRYSAIN